MLLRQIGGLRLVGGQTVIPVAIDSLIQNRCCQAASGSREHGGEGFRIGSSVIPIVGRGGLE